MKSQTNNKPTPLSDFDRAQFEIYATELREHYQEERRLRKDLEARNSELERRLAELTALNRMIQRHLEQVVYVRVDDVKELRRVRETTRAALPPANR